MTDPTPHLGDEIQDFLDGRLDPARDAVVRSHLATCETCRREWERLVWLKKRLRALANDAAAVPVDLEQTVRRSLEGERDQGPPWVATVDTDPAPQPMAASRRRAQRPRWLVAAGMAALLVLTIGGGAWWWLRPPTPSEIAADYASVAEGAQRIDYETRDPRSLERHFVAQGGVPTRVYDLGMMNYTLIGGRVQAHRGQPGTLAVYRGARGERVICTMYYAPPPSQPPIDRRVHNGIEFTVYQRGDIVMVFWDEGPVTCVLASTMDRETLIQLAFAKAARPLG